MRKHLFKKLASHSDQNWFSAVVFLRGILIYTEFPCLKIFPCILAHTFGIGLLLLMVGCTKEWQIIRLNIQLEGPRALKVPVKDPRIWKCLGSKSHASRLFPTGPVGGRHISWTVRAFNLIPTLRARPKHPLSFGLTATPAGSMVEQPWRGALNQWLKLCIHWPMQWEVKQEKIHLN